jgi:hypothetical protein
MEVCSICTKENSGIVSCHTCNNMVCASCMSSIFSGKNGRKSISFLLMHQKYCMKLGELAPIVPVIDDEPAYLRQFRATSRNAALELLLPKKVSDLMKEDHVSEDEEEIAERKRLEAERLRLAAEEAERLQRDNPASLRALQEQLDSRLRRFDRIAKDITEYTEKVLDKSHTDQFIARNTRLRTETIEKLRANVVLPLQELDKKARALNLTGEFITKFTDTVAEVLQKCELMSSEDPAEAVVVPRAASHSFVSATPGSPTTRTRTASTGGDSPGPSTARKRPG